MILTLGLRWTPAAGGDDLKARGKTRFSIRISKSLVSFPLQICLGMPSESERPTQTTYYQWLAINGANAIAQQSQDR